MLVNKGKLCKAQTPTYQCEFVQRSEKSLTTLHTFVMYDLLPYHISTLMSNTVLRGEH